MKQNNLLKNIFAGSILLLSATACTKETVLNDSEAAAIPNEVSLRTADSRTVFEPLFDKSTKAAISPAIALPNEKYERVVTLAGKGYQIYRVQENPVGSGKYEWVFVAPEATLHNIKGMIIGSHHAGPIWQDNAGNTVAAVKEAAQNSPDDPLRNIPWLKLKTTSAPATGMFAGVQYIQRICTIGGVAPNPSEATAANAGKEAWVPYLTIYNFYRSK